MSKLAFSLLIALSILSLVLSSLYSDAVLASEQEDENCVLVTHQDKIQVFHCYNPENDEFFYLNNMGFMMEDSN